MKSSEAVSLERQALSTSVYDLKATYSKQTSTPIDKIKLLYSKKPVADSKTLKDVLGPAAEKPPTEMQFSVMVMGGTAAAPAIERVASPPAEAPGPDMVAQQSPPGGKEVLQTDEFWIDLAGFVKQRIKDEAEGERVAGLFRSAWEKSGA